VCTCGWLTGCPAAGMPNILPPVTSAVKMPSTTTVSPSAVVLVISNFGSVNSSWNDLETSFAFARPRSGPSAALEAWFQ